MTLSLDFSGAYGDQRLHRVCVDLGVHFSFTKRHPLKCLAAACLHFLCPHFFYLHCFCLLHTG